MEWLFAALFAAALCFGFVLLYGAPYVPTLDPQVQTALSLIDLQEGQTLLELGCGDGKVLIAAAERGIYAIGYELNPIMAAVAWVRTRRYRSHVRVICGNFWNQSWPAADGIFVFLLDKYMPRLDTKITQNCQKPVRLVSFAFKVPGKQEIGQKNGIFYYEYL